MRKLLYITIFSICLLAICVSKVNANLMPRNSISLNFIFIAILVLVGEAYLVTLFFRTREYNRKYFFMLLLLLNLSTWTIFYHVHKKVINNVFIVESTIVILLGSTFEVEVVPVIPFAIESS